MEIDCSFQSIHVVKIKNTHTIMLTKIDVRHTQLH